MFPVERRCRDEAAERCRVDVACLPFEFQRFFCLANVAEMHTEVGHNVRSRVLATKSRSASASFRYIVSASSN